MSMLKKVRVFNLGGGLRLYGNPLTVTGPEGAIDVLTDVGYGPRYATIRTRNSGNVTLARMKRKQVQALILRLQCWLEDEENSHG